LGRNRAERSTGRTLGLSANGIIAYAQKPVALATTKLNGHFKKSSLQEI
jgi:hypothetical protein